MTGLGSFYADLTKDHRKKWRREVRCAIFLSPWKKSIKKQI